LVLVPAHSEKGSATSLKACEIWAGAMIVAKKSYRQRSVLRPLSIFGADRWILSISKGVPNLR
jgi:hypothetical protein